MMFVITNTYGTGRVVLRCVAHGAAVPTARQTGKADRLCRIPGTREQRRHVAAQLRRSQLQRRMVEQSLRRAVTSRPTKCPISSPRISAVSTGTCGASVSRIDASSQTSRRLGFWRTQSMSRLPVLFLCRVSSSRALGSLELKTPARVPDWPSRSVRRKPSAWSRLPRAGSNGRCSSSSSGISPNDWSIHRGVCLRGGAGCRKDRGSPWALRIASRTTT